ALRRFGRFVGVARLGGRSLRARLVGGGLAPCALDVLLEARIAGGHLRGGVRADRFRPVRLRGRRLRFRPLRRDFGLCFCPAFLPCFPAFLPSSPAFL